MQLDISELVMIASQACKKINNLSANAGNIDLEAIKVQNEILKYAYQSIQGWMYDQR